MLEGWKAIEEAWALLNEINRDQKRTLSIINAQFC